ncbi:DNA damage-regulated autophagy modulator protein 2 [Denticeps clupeoides]|uniref:CWH43-like N-terminal domain-containing protein n=1 Tax=Denticeps clupeoides TaxID=299321 RepID=A0AAY4EH56_9TELE|nr:DNA damage-regulated autophagy modulator protein 2-like [Denticeps clupeoides]
MWSFRRGLCWLPASLVAWSIATLAVSYATAVLLGHTDLLLPYISDTGTEIPERCVFGFMLTVSSFLGAATLYVRYKQVEALASQTELSLHRLNASGLALGLLSCCGMSVVANFQKSEMIDVHLFGAGLTFAGGVLYILVQTGVSYRMQPRFHGKDILWARTAVGLWTLVSIVILFVSSAIMVDEEAGVKVVQKLRWGSAESGYVAHLISAGAEWSLAFSFICFFLTFIRDFQKIQLQVKPILHCNHLYNYSHYEDRVHEHHGERSPLLAGAI